MNFKPTVENRFAEIDNLSFNGCAIGIRFKGGLPTKTFFSYPDEFLAEYQSNNLAEIDATLHYGFTNDGTVTWSELKRVAHSQRAFDLAKLHGVPDGICFALTIEGHKTIASVSQNPDDPFDDDEIRRIYETLVMASLDVANSETEEIYSKNTMDWLRLTAKGLDDKGVKDALSLSIHGAYARRRSSLAEICANTPAHAIAIAMGNGALSKYEFV